MSPYILNFHVNKKTKSPWNFYENFEDQKIGKVKLGKFDINDKGKGKKPFKIKQSLTIATSVNYRTNGHIVRIEGSNIDKNVNTYISNVCDLIIFREEYSSPFRRHSSIYG